MNSSITDEEFVRLAGDRLPDSPVARTTASVLFGAAVHASFPEALISVKNSDELEGPDVACWNGSAAAGGPDVVWVWAVADRESLASHVDNLDRQIEAASRDTLAAGRRIVPGPQLGGTLVGANLATDFVVVRCHITEPGLLLVESYDLRDDAIAAFQQDLTDATMVARREASKVNRAAGEARSPMR